ncbi:MAG: 4-hydroxythreonine-4-phosphate dehydrogenase PdxA [Polyangiaceae bacterium]|nr:4-hydroxythreonine-4-phosphate dehydrogenase PdxA [Polyangiaceae bacterium]
MSAVLAVSLGCPCGIGPEVSLRAAVLERRHVRAVLVGDPAVVERVRAAAPGARLVAVADAAGCRALAAGSIGVWSAAARLPAPPRPGRPDAAAGAAQLAWIDAALDLVGAGACDALVTGPVSKAAIASSGVRGAARFRGHTEHLAARLGVRSVVMAFAAPGLGRRKGCFATALVTTHLPLARVPRAVTRDKVAAATVALARLCRRLGVARPAIAVTGVNPHAGEDGLLGTEETRVVAPGIAAARALLRRARLEVELAGPLGAETAYRLAHAGRFHGVVAMYHDQATIACKLAGFGELVNVTLGLPVVRTSVDHGTGYDLAGTGRASPDGMRAALRMAAELAAPRRRA